MLSCVTNMSFEILLYLSCIWWLLSLNMVAGIIVWSWHFINHALCLIFNQQTFKEWSFEDICGAGLYELEDALNCQHLALCHC